MTNRVLLDNVAHADLTVTARRGAAFGDAVNQLLVFPTEFEPLQREYPILFRRRDTGDFYAVALLGLDLDENLFLDGADWRARYIPAVQQRGPFLHGPPTPDGNGDGSPGIYVDLGDARVGAKGGEPLFLRHGGRTPYLERIAGVLDVIRRGHESEAPFFAALAAADLIRPVSLDIEIGDGTVYTVADVSTVDQDRLAELGGTTLEQLHHAGFLRAAMMAATSIGNVARLIELKNARVASR